MKPSRLITLAVTAVALVGAIYFTTRNTKAPAEGGEIVWTDFGTGFSTAHTTNKKILIDVYTDWCTWCKTMDSKTYSDPEIAAYVRNHFVAVKLNAESQEKRQVAGHQLSDEDLAKAFEVSGFPTTIFTTADGKPITSKDGYVEAAEFKYILKYIGEDKYLTMSYADYKKSAQ